ncbi:unnamed protein product [Dovyalis caffra]|uniref:Uncharacterized protein n=1 Tax=Dovyalis caffra TaxID=77055 RepID=A0AAV1RGH9_9ROSI|nr:unnamed protein product [Dovyalis caffra]
MTALMVSWRNLSSSSSILKPNHCGVRGKFPDSIPRRSNLQVLNLWSNRYLIGSFPSSNGFLKGPTTSHAFPKLRIFDLYNNSLSGPLPRGYSSSLEAMMVSDQDVVYMRATNFSRSPGCQILHIYPGFLKVCLFVKDQGVVSEMRGNHYMGGKGK